MEHDDTIDWLPAIPADDEAPAEPSPPKETAASWARGIAYVPRHRRWRLPWAPVAFAGLLLLVLAAGGTAAWVAHNTPVTAALPATAPTAPYSAPTAPLRPTVAPSTPVPSATAVATPSAPAAIPVPSPPADTADTVVCTWVMGTGDCPSYSWEIQPTIIGFFSYMSYSISDITWSGYGTGLATGQGTASTNNCIPNCGDGTITTAPVTFTVQNLVPWNGGLAYDTITVPSGEYMLLTEGS